MISNSIKKRTICLFMVIVTSSFIEYSCFRSPLKNEKSIKDIDKVINMFKSQRYTHIDPDLRKFPYPYNAMLAICSDIDSTTLNEFKIYHRFLNTKEETAYGQGLWLDIADSFWLYLGKRNVRNVNLMTVCYGVDYNRFNALEDIKHYYDKGWIDSIHTFGDFSEKNSELYVLPTRKLAVAAWDILNKYNIKPSIWINHGNEKNVQNFGGYNPSRVTKFQQGDNPKSLCYHTDITIKNGIRYIWNSIESDKFGMDNPLFRIKLRDGQSVWGFNRFTNSYSNKGILWLWEPGIIYKEITKNNLDNLVRKKQYSIVTTHFGKGPLNKKGIDALKLLPVYQNRGNILIARTSRLLNYCLSQKYIKYASLEYKGKRYINIKSIDDPIFGEISPTVEKLRGITFYTKNAKDTIIMINGKSISSEEINRNSNVGSEQTISIKWFKQDYSDYSVKI